MMKVKYLFDVFPGATPDSKNEEYWDGDIVWVTPADFKTDEKYVFSGNRNITKAGYNSANTTIVPANSIIVSKRAPIGTVCIASVPLCTNQGCLSCVPHKDLINSTFAYYAFIAVNEKMQILGSGTTFKEISANAFCNMKIPYFSLSKQQSIVSFLDAKCAAIDDAINRHKSIIKKINEIIDSEISCRVNAGLKENVELKKTQYAWLDKMPAHWTTNKVKYISTKSVSYGVIKLYEPDENGVKVLRCSDVQKGYIVPDQIRTITKELSEEYARTILSCGDVVVNVRGTLGGCAVVPEEMCGYNVAREVAVVSPHRDKYDSKFIMYCLLSDHFSNYRTETLSGAVYMGINMETLGNYVCPVPPLHEQKEISDYLDDFCSKARESITRHDLIIHKLEEYRKSLIYHAVTGKIDCREAV